MNNFQFWKEEIADMPEKDAEGNWYDLETGLSFDPAVHYKTGGKTTRWQPKDDVKEHRAIAKFYGGKALTGSVKQKVWAESIRSKFLSSDELSDEQKSEFISLGGPVATAKFWISNKNTSPKHFTKETALEEDKKLGELYDRHYDTLIRTCSVCEKEKAKIEIYTALTNLKLKVKFDFPNYDFYDCFGELQLHEVKNDRLVRVRSK